MFFYKFNVYMAQRILCAAVYPGFLPCFVKGRLLQCKRPPFARAYAATGAKPWRSALWRHAPFAPRCGAVVADGSRVRPRL